MYNYFLYPGFFNNCHPRQYTPSFLCKQKFLPSDLAPETVCLRRCAFSKLSLGNVREQTQLWTLLPSRPHQFWYKEIRLTQMTGRALNGGEEKLYIEDQRQLMYLQPVFILFLHELIHAWFQSLSVLNPPPISQTSSLVFDASDSTSKTEHLHLQKFTSTVFPSPSSPKEDIVVPLDLFPCSTPKTLLNCSLKALSLFSFVLFPVSYLNLRFSHLVVILPSLI